MGGGVPLDVVGGHELTMKRNKWRIFCLGWRLLPGHNDDGFELSDMPQEWTVNLKQDQQKNNIA